MKADCKWRRVPIVDLCETHVDCVNRTAPVVEGATEFKMIRTTNVRNGFIDVENVRYVDEPTFRRWTRRLVPKAQDVILTREAPLGEVGMLRTNAQIFLGQRLYHFRPDPEKLNPYFLLYSLLDDDLQGQIRGFGSGSTVEHMRLGDIPKLKIKVPEIKEQRRIAGILSAYDDLIENNLRRIQILEQMAQSLYREWFVHFRYPGHASVPLVDSPLGPIPKGWEVKKMGELYKTSSGGTPSRKKTVYYEGGTIDWVKTGELRDGFVLSSGEKITPEALKASSAKLFPSNTVLIALYGATIGQLGILSREASTNQACCAFLETQPPFGRAFAFLTMRTRREDIIGLRLGAAQQNISQAILREFQVVCAPIPLLEDFNVRAEPIFDLLLNLQRRNQTLCQTRDLLLPKLLTPEPS